MSAISEEIVQFRAPTEMREWIKEEAEREGRTVANLLRWILTNEKQRREEEA